MWLGATLGFCNHLRGETRRTSKTSWLKQRRESTQAEGKTEALRVWAAPCLRPSFCVRATCSLQPQKPTTREQSHECASHHRATEAQGPGRGDRLPGALRYPCLALATGSHMAFPLSCPFAIMSEPHGDQERALAKARNPGRKCFWLSRRKLGTVSF